MRKNTVALLALLAGVFCHSAMADPTATKLRWSAVMPMSESRLGHAMVELQPGPNALGLSTGSGKVMVIGGFDSEPVAVPYVPGNPLATCEIYDPVTNTWTFAAPHPVPGGWRWAVTLPNGMVLVAGGLQTLGVNLADSHLYDPVTDKWIATRSLPIGTNNPHSFMRPVVLPTGQALIAGGEDDNSTKTPELTHSSSAYLFTLNEHKPSSSSWDYTRNPKNHKISKMPEGRTTSALLLMSDGRVLNAGGLGPAANGLLAATNTASVYDPKTGTWSQVAPMPPVTGLGEDEYISAYPTGPGSRWAPFSASLDDGQVLIAGGSGGAFFEVFRRSAVLYDPKTNVWRSTTPMQFRYFVGSWAAKLPADTGVFFSGAAYTNSYQVVGLVGETFQPSTKTWTMVPRAGGPPSDGSFDSFESQSVLLSTGSLHVSGGVDLSTGTWGTNGSWKFGATPQ